MESMTDKITYVYNMTDRDLISISLHPIIIFLNNDCYRLLFEYAKL
jgi:hypothetical protein